MTTVTVKRVLLILAVIVVVLAVGLSVAVARLEPRLQREVVRVLESRMDADVTLDTFNVHFWPRPGVSGGGLAVRHHDHPDAPPLVTVRHFAGDASWIGIFGARMRTVSLDGLEITIPPRRAQQPPARISLGQAAPPAMPGMPVASSFSIATVTATNARLSILPRSADKDPRVFDIFALELRDVTMLAPSRFTASLTNPVPQGTIETSGSFGPWNGAEPSQTPVEGDFRFDADLGTIRGIAGALHSTGAFDGTIDRIGVSGTTETPDFRIPKLDAAALPLTTTFNAIVDGTNGDVELNPVEARLADSRFVARGAIVGTKGIKGKHVQLEVTSDDARMEDILRLTVRSLPPAMTGTLTLTTSFDLPQGDRDVIDRLELAGSVTIANAKFTSDAVQDKVDDLSRRGSGRPEDTSIANVQSTIRTEFSMADGAIRVKGLTYTIDGVTVQLAGSYTLASRAMDFAGTALLAASVSQTQTGVRHFLLKPFDAVFRREGGGSKIPIKIGGTVDKPEFGLDVGRTLRVR